MNMKSNTRNGSIHLYNPKQEGLGPYDIHYINAYKKNKKLEAVKRDKVNKRYAA